jgi:hypothetical protein
MQRYQSGFRSTVISYETLVWVLKKKLCMASLIWADPTRPITEAMVTYWASEGVSNSMH